MESKFNFKSSVCTSREQSERLLALGLKKETADICLQSTLNDVWSPYIPIAMPYSKVEALDLSKDVFRIIPAWSLGRLLEIMRMKASSQIVPLDNTFNRLIEGIETRIKESYFNKEYLEIKE